MFYFALLTYLLLQCLLMIDYSICNACSFTKTNLAIVFINRFQKQRPRRCSLFLKILQNIQENTSAGSSYLIKLLKIPATLLKKRVRHRCFPINFAKFLRTAFLQSTSEQLLLEFYALKLKSKIKKGNFSRNEY